jgi:hypothetical protein
MGISFTVYPLARVVAYTVDGGTTANDAREFLDAVVAHRHYRRGFDFLGDPSGAGGELGQSHLRSLALEAIERAADLAPCRWAVVVSSDVELGMVRMWAALMVEASVEVAAFTSLAEASEWVGANTAERRARWPAS